MTQTSTVIQMQSNNAFVSVIKTFEFRIFFGFRHSCFGFLIKDYKLFESMEVA
jgi:hypothetical protein